MATANIHIGTNQSDSAAACAAFIAARLRDAITARDRAMLAISGGNTPKLMFRDLAASGIDWNKIHIFFVDERCVPPDDDRSNYKMAKANLFDPAHAAHVHRIAGEVPPEEAAEQYVADIAETFGLKGGELPVFDVLHRGMGADAHTASLFPGEPKIADRTGIAAHVWVEKLKMDRVTLLPGVLLAAANTVLQVEGPDKAEPLHQVLFGPEDAMRFPCQLATRGSRNAFWFVDEAAAAGLPRT